MNKLMVYQGAKDKFFVPLNNIIRKSKKKKIYVEPFIGSGFMFLNVEDVYDKYYINDFNPEIIKIYNSINNLSPSNILKIVNQILSRFGNISKNGESFDNFKKYFNEKIWNKDDKFIEGVCILMLYKNCFNNFGFFNKNGFTQSHGGGRGNTKIDTQTIRNIKTKLSKTEISSGCALSLIEELDNKYNGECLMFLDPPYFTRSSGSYKDFSQNEYDRFINICINLKSDWLYTDMEENQLSNYKGFILRNEIQKTTNDGKPIKEGKEIVITNITK